MATHSSTIAQKIPWTEEPSRLHVVHGVAKSWTRLSEQTATNVCDCPGGSDGDASAYNAGDLG